MSRARNRPLPRVLALVGLAGVWVVACGGPQPLRGSGSVCFRADECQPGLACIPETPGATKHVCSADLSGIVSMVDGAAPDPAEMPEAMGGASAAPEGGGPATAGAPPSTGAAGKPATGGSPGAGGGATTAGGSASAGAPAAGAAAGGASAAGAPAGGSASAGGGAANGGAAAGTGG
ncbi:MAG: hypothetical protein WDO74_21320 [Pseudomonadota bacterium]